MANGIIKKKQFVKFHLHTDYSNCNGYSDSCTSYEEYIKLAVEQGMTAIAFSEHGNIYDWILKKQKCDNAGLKYIHGIEAYLCKELGDNERGAHIGLYARNFDGVLELNTIISKMDIKDGHMYFTPRLSLEELENTSANIIITTACLASPLNKWSDSFYDRLVNWLAKNTDRCFLEIQYHNCESQIQYNHKLYDLSKETGLKLIAGTDTHSSNKYKAECRKILQKSKDSFYGEEDEFDLCWKTYDELVSAFETQGALPEDVYLTAIENTNVFADMVESFKLDKSFKYPNLYGDNVSSIWKKHIFEKIKSKLQSGAIKKIDLDKYKNLIAEEFQVMRKMGMESFMMFMSELLNWCTQNGIPYGFGRGSVAGSEIAYITDITDVDPVVWKTVFSRFCNADRISLGDIDIDFAPEDREKVYEYIINRFTPEKTAYIATFGTLQVRGCIDVLTKGLDYKDLDKVMSIKNTYEDIFKKYSKIIQEEVNSEELVENGELESGSISIDNHEIYISRINDNKSKNRITEYKKEYEELIDQNQDLFYYFKGLKGTIINKGIHPSGIIGSPITLYDHLGIYHREGEINFPVSSCCMKAVDSLNFVKFDILGLNTVGIIKDACEYIGIKYPKSHEVNWLDSKVWSNMITERFGVFQFEGSYAHGLLSDFKPKTVNHMSMVNAALRPSGKSYRDRMIAGEVNKNPSEQIDDLLRENNGFLIFQEDTIKFLTDVCGFSGSAADTTRRAIGKKDIESLNEQLPLILEGYCNTSPKPRKIAEEEAKQFIQIIQDSSEYQFGYNHSTAYSMNGYICTMLRTHYPIEFVAAYINRAQEIEDVNNGALLAQHYGITINPIQFGYSRSKYEIDKKNNAIYKGINSIKWCNKIIADELFELANSKKYTDFTELLFDINIKTSVTSRQLTILTTLHFFSMFGKNAMLLEIIEKFNSITSKKQFKLSDLEKLGVDEQTMMRFTNKRTEKLFKEVDIANLLKYVIESIPDKNLSVREQIKREKKYMECILYTNPTLPENVYFVDGFKTYKDKTRPYLILYCMKNGNSIKTKITNGKKFGMNFFTEDSVIRVTKWKEQNKRKNINGVWVKTSELEKIVEDWEVY